MNPITRIQKISRAIDIICRILCVLLIIGFVLVAIGSVVLYALPANFLSVTLDGSALVDVDLSWVPGDLDLTEHLDDIMATEDGQTVILGVEPQALHLRANGDDFVVLTNHRLATLLLVLLVSIAGVYVVLRFVRELAVCLRQTSTPFAPQVVRQLKRVGWALLAWSVVPGVIGVVAAALMQVDPGRVDITINFDFATVLVALFFLVLVYVFQYGAQLQQQSDETL